MSFKSAVQNTTVQARTTNGMKAIRSTLSNNVDLFFSIGASRGKNITRAFEKAFNDDRETALRVAQWSRDIRGGAGERELFRQILKFLEKNHKDVLLETKVLENVSEIGRWDDLLIFEDKEVQERAFTIIAHALTSLKIAHEVLPKIERMSEEECKKVLDQIRSIDLHLSK